MTQTAVPTEVISNDMIVAEAARATDEPWASHDGDTTYIETDSTSMTIEMALEELVDPVSSSGHKLKAVYRGVGTLASPSETIDISLVQGTTVIFTKTVPIRRATWLSGSWALSTAQADSIKD